MDVQEQVKDLLDLAPHRWDSLSQLAQDLANHKLPGGSGQVTPALMRPLTSFFLAVFALSSKVSFVLTDEELANRVAAVLARHAHPSTLLVCAQDSVVPPTEAAAAAAAARQQQPSSMGALMQEFAQHVGELSALTTLPYPYATVRHSVQVTNDFFAGLCQRDPHKSADCWSRVLAYLESRSGGHSQACPPPHLVSLVSLAN